MGGGEWYLSSSLFVVTLFFNDHVSTEYKVCLVLINVDKASLKLDILYFSYSHFLSCYLFVTIISIRQSESC